MVATLKPSPAAPAEAVNEDDLRAVRNAGHPAAMLYSHEQALSEKEAYCCDHATD